MKPRATCPSCKKPEGVPIAYGYPSDEMFAAEKRGDVILGGCVVMRDGPQFRCRACGHMWRNTDPYPPLDFEV